MRYFQNKVNLKQIQSKILDGFLKLKCNIYKYLGYTNKKGCDYIALNSGHWYNQL